MLLGPVLGSTLFLVLGILRPVAYAYRALDHGTPYDATRWLSFFVCASLFILPMMVWVPSWVPLRYEIAVCVLATLGMSEARVAEVVYQRYIHATLTRVMEPMSSMGDVDGFLCALETVGQRNPPMPSPVDTTRATDDSNSGGMEDDARDDQK